jgi:hypothetical protein
MNMIGQPERATQDRFIDPGRSSPISAFRIP